MFGNRCRRSVDAGVERLRLDAIDDCVEIDSSNTEIARDEKMTIEMWTQAARFARITSGFASVGTPTLLRDGLPTL